MGSHPTQAVALLIFMLAFIAVAIGFASGGGILPFIAGLALMVVAFMMLLKCKPKEHAE